MEANLDRIENLLRLASEARDGRPEALGELLRESAGILNAFVRSRLGDGLLVDEATQSALIRVARGFPGLSKLEAYPAWLKTIALRAASDAARATTDILPSASPDGIADPDPGPEAHAEQRERSQQVRAAVDRLPARLRDPVLLVYAEGLSYREIAVLLGMSAATVTRRIAAAHERLRKMLGDEP